MKYGILIIVSLILLGSFIFTSNDIPDFSAPSSPSLILKEEHAIYGSWRWIKTTDYSQNNIAPKNSDEFVLTITPEGKLTSTTDCNFVTGSIIFNKEIVSVGSLLVTEMACSGETQEAMYLNDLARATSYAIEGNILTIQQIKDFGIMEFERVSQ